MDARDHKLAFLLSRNGRASFQALGRTLGLSPDGARYRLEKLEKQGVVRSYVLVPNTFALGKMITSVFVSFRSLPREAEERLTGFFNRTKEIVFAYKTQGEWDLVFQVEHRGMFSLHLLLQEFKTLCGEERIDRHFFQSHVGEYKFRQAPEAILGGQKTPELPAPKADASFVKDFLDSPPIELDPAGQDATKITKSDWATISMLSENARMSLTELAEKTGLSVDQVRYKIRGLIRHGTIQAFWAVIDLQKFGLQRFDLLIRMKTPDQKQKERMNVYFLNHPNVVRAILVCGPYDLWLNVAFEDLAHCHAFIQEITGRFADSILDVDLLVVFEELKFKF